MTQIVTIASNAVVAKLHEPTKEVKMEVQQILSYMVAGAEQSDAFKQHRWDGRSSFLDYRSGTFPAGFVHLVAAHMKRRGYEVRTVRKPMPEPLGPVNPVVDNLGNDPRYDYQPEVVTRLVRHGAIIAQVATGGGKSRIARMAFARINRPTLFLTTRSILMYQMKRSFENDMGAAVSVLGDGQFGHTIVDGNGNERQAIKKMCVGMVQTLAARLEIKTIEGVSLAMVESMAKKEQSQLKKIKSPAERARREQALLRARPSDKQIIEEAKKVVERQALVREQTIRLLEKFELVIGEEAHEVSGDSYTEILRHCKNAHYRLALTATPFMKDDEEANMKLMASFGPVAIKITEKMLIDRGILAKPYFKYIPSRKRPMHLLRNTAWQSAYRIGIVENAERNQDVVNAALWAKEWGLTSMCLVQHTNHGEILRAKLNEAGLRAEFIHGESDTDMRADALKRLGQGQIDVLIGTNILDVGVDVPAVGVIILAGGGKAEVALRQRIGRGLRAKKKGPNVAFVFDFEDSFNNHLIGHAQTRKAIVLGTPGFAENVLPAGHDFDMKALGFAKVGEAA